MGQVLRIGTRGSALALQQTKMVVDALTASVPDLTVEIIEIKTSGDWSPAQGETRLSALAGGKGLFAKEIEERLLAGDIDCGVHSVKDMSTFLPDGLALRHTLPREDARDAFISAQAATYRELPPGATVGTVSVRRAAFLRAKRPDLEIVAVRGNVNTRLEKLRQGQVDALFLAVAGLKRLGLEDQIASIIDIKDMLPAVGQGAVGIEIRADDDRTAALLDTIHCAETGLRVAAERAALAVLDGSCHTPIGAHAVFDDHMMNLVVAVAAPDGQTIYEETRRMAVATPEDATQLGQDVGQRLKDRLPDGFLTQE